MESDDKSSIPSFDSIEDLLKMSAENQRQIEAANSLINNSAIQAIVDKFSIENFAKNHPLADEIENGVKELIKENNKLKETLRTNNISMKRHFAIIENWLEDPLIGHRHFKKKLEEAKEINGKLRTENNDQKRRTEEMVRSIENKYMTEKAKMHHENQMLRDKLTVMQQKLFKCEQQVSAFSNKPDREQELMQIIATLNKQLENSEKARKRLTIEVERYEGQEIKLQTVLSNGGPGNVTNACFWNAIFPSVRISSPRENQLMDNLRGFYLVLQQEVSTSSASRYNEESCSDMCADVDGNVKEKSIDQLKEDIVVLRRQLLKERNTRFLYAKTLDDMRSKYEIIYQQSLAILKEHDSKMRAQQIKLLKAQEDARDVNKLRHELGDRQNRIIQLETDLNCVRKKLEVAEKKSEDFNLLQSQIKFYEEDFLSERDAKEALINEKAVMQRNVNSLQKRNKELMKQLRMYSGDSLNNLTSSEALVNTPQFICFNESCGQSFASEEELQAHIYYCLNIKD